MKIIHSKKSIITGISIAIIMSFFLLFNVDFFFASKNPYSLILLISLFLVTILTGLLISFKIEFKKDKNTNIVNSVFFVILPIASMQMIEALNNVFIYDFSPRSFIGNYVVYLLFYFLLFILTSSFKISILILNPLFLIFGLINYFVEMFRGSPFVPMDILSLTTAKSVAGTYTYTLSINIIVAFILFIFLMAAGIKINSPVLSLKPKFFAKGFALFFIVTVLGVFYGTNTIANLGIKPDFWNQLRGYQNSGALLNFCINTKYLFVTKPSGYNSDEIENIVTDSIDSSDDLSILDSSQKTNDTTQTDNTENNNQQTKADNYDNNQIIVNKYEKKNNNQTTNLAKCSITGGIKNTALDAFSKDKLDKGSTSTNEPSDEISADNSDNYNTATAKPDVASNPLNSFESKIDSASVTNPNIICIMNESLSDLSVLGDFTTNEDYMPFIHSLEKNTIKGNLYVPVNGAGTSNTEYEFLTGNSISFLPAGCNVYQSYIKSETSSLVSTLEAQGYSSTAFHPYYASGWNRDKVYPYMGFDNFISIESIIDNSILESYEKSNYNIFLFQNMLSRHYPGEDILLRRYVSDSYDFQLIEDYYNNRDTSKPFFLFNVTMQNHGGYAMTYSNFIQKIQITSSNNEYALANQYLSLVKESDTAFKELLTYFSNINEPTIICMFGDHQPYIEDTFLEELLGNSLDSLSNEQLQSRYITPFIIWANYDIPEATIDKISSNYLSTLLLQISGVKMTEYNQYVASLYSKLPVIDTVGYIDANNNYYSYDDKTDYKDILLNYKKVQYNGMFDEDNKKKSIFYLNNK